jgi:hypothetical protein
MNFEITGDDAFYKKENYLEQTRADFSSTKCVGEPVYYYETSSKVWRIAKEIFSVLLVLPLIYNIIHGLVGKIIILASFQSQTDISLENSIYDYNKYKRFTIDVNGYKIDTLIVGTKETFEKKRWLVANMGNGMHHEDGVNSEQIAKARSCNAIFFNYPGVGASTGLPNRVAMRDSYRAVLQFIEELGAKEIIGYSYATGGGFQADALNGYELKEGVKYVFIKDRTFSSLPDIAGNLVFRPAKWFLKLMGWNMDSVESSKVLSCGEIVMQKGISKQCKLINSSDELAKNDGVIIKNASLAKALMDDPTMLSNKCCLAIPEYHNDQISKATDKMLSKTIGYFLSGQGSGLTL